MRIISTIILCLLLILCVCGIGVCGTFSEITTMEIGGETIQVPEEMALPELTLPSENMVRIYSSRIIFFFIDYKQRTPPAKRIRYLTVNYPVTSRV